MGNNSTYVRMLAASLFLVLWLAIMPCVDGRRTGEEFDEADEERPRTPLKTPKNARGEPHSAGVLGVAYGFHGAAAGTFLEKAAREAVRYGRRAHQREATEKEKLRVNAQKVGVDDELMGLLEDPSGRNPDTGPDLSLKQCIEAMGSETQEALKEKTPSEIWAAVAGEMQNVKVPEDETFRPQTIDLTMDASAPFAYQVLGVETDIPDVTDDDIKSAWMARVKELKEKVKDHQGRPVQQAALDSDLALVHRIRKFLDDPDQKQAYEDEFLRRTTPPSPQRRGDVALCVQGQRVYERAKNRAGTVVSTSPGNTAGLVTRSRTDSASCKVLFDDHLMRRRGQLVPASELEWSPLHPLIQALEGDWHSTGGAEEHLDLRVDGAAVTLRDARHRTKTKSTRYGLLTVSGGFVKWHLMQPQVGDHVLMASQGRSSPFSQEDGDTALPDWTAGNETAEVIAVFNNSWPGKVRLSVADAESWDDPDAEADLSWAWLVMKKQLVQEQAPHEGSPKRLHWDGGEVWEERQRNHQEREKEEEETLPKKLYFDFDHPLSLPVYFNGEAKVFYHYNESEVRAQKFFQPPGELYNVESVATLDDASYALLDQLSESYTSGAVAQEQCDTMGALIGTELRAPPDEKFDAPELPGPVDDKAAERPTCRQLCTRHSSRSSTDEEGMSLAQLMHSEERCMMLLGCRELDSLSADSGIAMGTEVWRPFTPEHFANGGLDGLAHRFPMPMCCSKSLRAHSKVEQILSRAHAALGLPSRTAIRKEEETIRETRLMSTEVMDMVKNLREKEYAEMDTFAPAMYKKMKRQPPAMIAEVHKVKTKMVEVASAQMEEFTNFKDEAISVAWCSGIAHCSEGHFCFDCMACTGSTEGIGGCDVCRNFDPTEHHRGICAKGTCTDDNAVGPCPIHIEEPDTVQDAMQTRRCNKQEGHVKCRTGEYCTQHLACKDVRHCMGHHNPADVSVDGQCPTDNHCTCKDYMTKGRDQCQKQGTCYVEAGCKHSKSLFWSPWDTCQGRTLDENMGVRVRYSPIDTSGEDRWWQTMEGIPADWNAATVARSFTAEITLPPGVEAGSQGKSESKDAPRGATDAAQGCGFIHRNSMEGKILMVKRGGCSFTLKGMKAQQAGASALIILGATDDMPSMEFSGYDGEYPPEGTPALYVDYAQGGKLWTLMERGKRVRIEFTTGQKVEFGGQYECRDTSATSPEARRPCEVVSIDQTGSGVKYGVKFLDESALDRAKHLLRDNRLSASQIFPRRGDLKSGTQILGYYKVTRGRSTVRSENPVPGVVLTTCSGRVACPSSPGDTSGGGYFIRFQVRAPEYKRDGLTLVPKRRGLFLNQKVPEDWVERVEDKDTAKEAADATKLRSEEVAFESHQLEPWDKSSNELLRLARELEVQLSCSAGMDRSGSTLIWGSALWDLEEPVDRLRKKLDEGSRPILENEETGFNSLAEIGSVRPYNFRKVKTLLNYFAGETAATKFGRVSTISKDKQACSDLVALPEGSGKIQCLMLRDVDVQAMNEALRTKFMEQFDVSKDELIGAAASQKGSGTWMEYIGHAVNIPATRVPPKVETLWKRLEDDGLSPLALPLDASAPVAKLSREELDEGTVLKNAQEALRKSIDGSPGSMDDDWTADFHHPDRVMTSISQLCEKAYDPLKIEDKDGHPIVTYEDQLDVGAGRTPQDYSWRSPWAIPRLAFSCRSLSEISEALQLLLNGTIKGLKVVRIDNGWVSPGATGQRDVSVLLEQHGVTKGIAELRLSHKGMLQHRAKPAADDLYHKVGRLAGKPVCKVRPNEAALVPGFVLERLASAAPAWAADPNREWRAKQRILAEEEAARKKEAEQAREVDLEAREKKWEDRSRGIGFCISWIASRSQEPVVKRWPGSSCDVGVCQVPEKQPCKVSQTECPNASCVWQWDEPGQESNASLVPQLLEVLNAGQRRSTKFGLGSYYYNAQEYINEQSIRFTQSKTAEVASVEELRARWGRVGGPVAWLMAQIKRKLTQASKLGVNILAWVLNNPSIAEWAFEFVYQMRRTFCRKCLSEWWFGKPDAVYHDSILNHSRVETNQFYEDASEIASQSYRAGSRWFVSFVSSNSYIIKYSYNAMLDFANPFQYVFAGFFSICLGYAAASWFTAAKTFSYGFSQLLQAGSAIVPLVAPVSGAVASMVGGVGQAVGMAGAMGGAWPAMQFATVNTGTVVSGAYKGYQAAVNGYQAAGGFFKQAWSAFSPEKIIAGVKEVFLGAFQEKIIDFIQEGLYLSMLSHSFNSVQNLIFEPCLVQPRVEARLEACRGENRSRVDCSVKWGLSKILRVRHVGADVGGKVMYVGANVGGKVLHEFGKAANLTVRALEAQKQMALKVDALLSERSTAYEAMKEWGTKLTDTILANVAGLSETVSQIKRTLTVDFPSLLSEYVQSIKESFKGFFFR